MKRVLIIGRELSLYESIIVSLILLVFLIVVTVVYLFICVSRVFDIFLIPVLIITFMVSPLDWIAIFIDFKSMLEVRRILSLIASRGCL